MWQTRIFQGEEYNDPREELRARAEAARDAGETHFAASVSLVTAALDVRECDSTTVVNGNRMEKMLIQIKCTKTVDPTSGKHVGMHQNGRNNW